MNEFLSLSISQAMRGTDEKIDNYMTAKKFADGESIGLSFFPPPPADPPAPAILLQRKAQDPCWVVSPSFAG